MAGTLLSRIESAYAIAPFKKQFEEKYVKKDPQTPEEKALAAAVTEAKCNVCHVGKSKKNRNNYGEALNVLLDKKADMKDTAKIQAALDTVAEQKSNPTDPNSPTFGELIKQGKLPGGSEAVRSASK
ncbi:MAG TPA: hypothetical protein VFW87_24530 [Pirellulales bacterium]|nr:hypothetical protein [Pirellulales bacterium]